MKLMNETKDSVPQCGNNRVCAERSAVSRFLGTYARAHKAWPVKGLIAGNRAGVN